MIESIVGIYPWYSLKSKTDRQVACIYNNIIHETIDTRKKTYKNFMAKCKDFDMYHEVLYLYNEIL